MLLAIDAGNTNVVFAVFDGDEKRGQWRISTDSRRTADEYAVWLFSLMTIKGLKPTDIHAAVMSSVVPAATFDLMRLCSNHFRCDPMRVGDPGVDLGIKVLLDNPKEAGADRLVNSIAAVHSYKPPLIIVDVGTGTTFDVVDRDGNFVGGCIAPGPNLALDALHKAAAQLPRVEILRPAQVIGKGTVGAMQSGMFWGYTGMIEGLITRISAELSPGGVPPVTVIATGGLGSRFAEASSMIHHFDNELTMRGLLSVYKRNTVA